MILKTRARLQGLYNQVGGEVQLRAILHDFYQRMAKDVLIGFFFDGRDPIHIANRQLEFLLMAMGIRHSYLGKIPAKAHTALPPILKGHFDRRLVLLAETLKDHGLAESDIQIWIDFEKAFEDVVVQGASKTS